MLAWLNIHTISHWYGSKWSYVNFCIGRVHLKDRRRKGVCNYSPYYTRQCSATTLPRIIIMVIIMQLKNQTFEISPRVAHKKLDPSQDIWEQPRYKRLHVDFTICQSHCPRTLEHSKRHKAHKISVKYQKVLGTATSRQPQANKPTGVSSPQVTYLKAHNSTRSRCQSSRQPTKPTH